MYTIINIFIGDEIMSTKFRRLLFIVSKKGEDDVLDFLKSLPNWDYNEVNMMGTHQQFLKNEKIEIYIRTGFKDNAYMTSNILPQDTNSESAPDLFKDDDLYKLYQDIIKERKNNKQYSHIGVEQEDSYI